MRQARLLPALALALALAAPAREATAYNICPMIPGTNPERVDDSINQEARPVTLVDPSAVCNDGRRAKYTVKLASPASRHWVIHFQGGGQCGNDERCSKRWFDDFRPGASDSNNYSDGETGGHNAMVPGYQANFTDGLLDYCESGNPFSGVNGLNSGRPMNRVYVEYCSSDTWTGRGGQQSTAVNVSCSNLPGASNDPSWNCQWNPRYWVSPPCAPAPRAPLGGITNILPPPAVQVCREGRVGSICGVDSDCGAGVVAGSCESRNVIIFAGANIVDAVIRSIRDGGALCGASHDEGIPEDCLAAGEASKPASGSEIIVSGSSAGGVGIIQNVDRIADLLAKPPPGETEAPQFFFMGVTDSADAVGFKNDGSLTTESSQASHNYWAGDPSLHRAETRTDSSCSAAIQQACTATAGVLKSHIESRLVVVENGLDTGPHTDMYGALVEEYTVGQGRPLDEAQSIASACVRAQITKGVDTYLSAMNPTGANKHWRITNYVASGSDGGLHQQLVDNDRMYAKQADRPPLSPSFGTPNDGGVRTSLASVLDGARCISRGGRGCSLRTTRVRMTDSRLKRFLNREILSTPQPLSTPLPLVPPGRDGLDLFITNNCRPTP